MEGVDAEEDRVEIHRGFKILKRMRSNPNTHSTQLIHSQSFTMCLTKRHLKSPAMLQFVQPQARRTRSFKRECRNRCRKGVAANFRDNNMKMSRNPFIMVKPHHMLNNFLTTICLHTTIHLSSRK